jgi:hypothetical protein
MSRLSLAALMTGLALTVAACGGVADTPDIAEGTSGHGPPTSRPTRTVAVPPAPEVGQCRALSYAEISLFSNDGKPVPCAKEHTAFTFHVAALPGDVAFEGVEIKNDAVQDAAAAACQDSYAGFIGGSTATRALARLTVTYFVPDQQSFDAGAQWVRCDVVALQSASALAPLPDQLEGYLDGDKALDDYGVCSRGNPSESGSGLVMCSQEHTYRAVAALRLGEADASYPGEKEVLDDGKQQCEELLKEQLGVGGGFTYAWTYPSSQDWAGGQRFGYCWNQSSS